MTETERLVSGRWRQGENAPAGRGLAIVRDVSDSARVEGETRRIAGLVLDMDTGLIRSVVVGSTDTEALLAAFQNGLTKPAGAAPGPAHSARASNSAAGGSPAARGRRTPSPTAQLPVTIL